MKKLRKILRQNVATLPQQSLTAMKVAFGVRAQYVTILTLAMLMATQVAGVVIFSGKAQANGSVTLSTTITNGFGGTLSAPAAVVVASDDSFYVASSGNDKIYKYNSSGVPVASIGGSGTGDGQLSAPGALALDAAGNLFVFDRGNVRIQKFDSSGNFVTKWGSAGTGDGQFIAAYEGYGRGIAVAPNGDVYVVDHANDRIQVFDNEGTFLRKWSVSRPVAIAVDAAGRVWSHGGPYTAYGQPIGGTTGELCEYSMTISLAGDMYCPNNYGQAIKLNLPATARTRIATWGSGIALMDSVAADSRGKIYATNVYSNQVQVYDDHSAYVQATTTAATDVTVQAATLHGNTTISGVTAKGFQFGTTTGYGLPGIPDTSAPTAAPIRSIGTVGTGANEVRHPFGLAVASDGNYYVSDDSTSGLTIKKYNSSSNVYMGGIDAAGYGITPGSMEVDSLGNLYVTNMAASPSGGHKVWKFDSSGGLAGNWGQIGNADNQLSGYGGEGDIAIDSHDNVYIPDGDQIKKFDSSGNYITKWGSLGTGDGQIYDASSIAIGADDSVYVVDGPNYRIQKFDSSGNYITKWGSLGTGDGQFKDEPFYIAVFGRHVYTQDRGQNRLLTFTTDGAFVQATAVVNENNSPRTPGNMKVDDIGNVLMLKRPGIDSPAIRVYKPDNQVMSYNATSLTCGTTYHYRAYATNMYGTVYGADQQFTTNACLAITTTSLPDGDLGQYYNQTIQNNGAGARPDNHIIMGKIAGEFPPGLYMDSQGVLEGDPTETGLYTFTIRAITEDSSQVATRELSIFVNGTNLDVVDSSNTINVGESYSDQVQFTGGLGGAVQFGTNPSNFPPGLTIDSNGLISGTPTTAGTYSSNIRVTENFQNGYGGQSQLIGDGTVQFEVTQQDPPHIIGGGITGGRVGTVYSSTTIANSVYGGFGYKSFEVTGGSLPPGLSFDVDGSLHGTPTTAGAYAFTVEVSDITGSDHADFTLTIGPALAPRTNTPIVMITSPTANTVFDYLHDDVAITGTGPANQTITTSMDGYVLGTTTADGDGNWSYAASNVFPGDHNFEAKWIPAKDVAFIPFVRNADESSEIKVIDTASRQLVKTILLPQDSFARYSTVNHAGSKVYVSGFDNTTHASKIWEFDVASGVLTRTFTNSEYTYSLGDLQITDDDQYAYVNKITEDNLVVIKLDLASFTVSGTPHLIPISGTEWTWAQGGYRVQPMVLSNQSLYASVSKTNTGTSDITVVNSINQVVSSIIIPSQTSETSGTYHLIAVDGDNVYVIKNNNLITVDATSDTVTHIVAVEELDTADNLPISLAVDAAHNKAYVGIESGIYSIDIATGDATLIPLSDAHPYSFYPVSIDLTSNKSQLYIGTVYGNVQILDTATGQLIAADNLAPDSYTGQLRSVGNFVDHIQSPTASTTFSVGMAPEVVEPVDPDPVDPIEPEQPIDPEEQPTVTNVTPAPTTSTQVTPPKITSIKAPQSVIAAQNNLFALAKRFPEPFAIGFPWFLLALALILVGIQYFQVHSESASTKRIQANVAKQERLVDEQNNFVALSTHYLHTPLTVMEGEISLMVKAGTLTQAQATKLKATLAGLNAEAEAALAQEEQGE